MSWTTILRRALSASTSSAIQVTAQVIGDDPVVPGEELPVEDPRALPDGAVGDVALLGSEGLGEVDPVDPAVRAADQRVLLVAAVVVDEVLEDQEVGHGPFVVIRVLGRNVLFPALGIRNGVADEDLEGARRLGDRALDDRRDEAEPEVLVQRVGGQVVLVAVGQRIGPPPVDVAEHRGIDLAPGFQAEPPGVGPAARAGLPALDDRGLEEILEFLGSQGPLHRRPVAAGLKGRFLGLSPEPEFAVGDDQGGGHSAVAPGDPGVDDPDLVLEAGDVLPADGGTRAPAETVVEIAVPHDHDPGLEVGQDPLDLGLGRFPLGGESAEPERAVRLVDDLRLEGPAVFLGIAHPALEELELGAHDGVHLAKRPLGELLADPGMGVDDSVDLDDGVLPHEPVAAGVVEALDVGAPGLGIPPGDRSLPVGEEGVLGGRFRSGLLEDPALRRGQRPDVLGFPGQAEFLRQEGQELLDRDVAGVIPGDPGDVHLLVVAEERVDHPARGRGFPLEAHEEFEDLPGVGTPVHDVAELDEVRSPARPVEIAVDEADLRMGEDEDESVEVAVEVGDGHDAFDPRPLVRDVGGGDGAARGGEDGERKEDEEERQDQEEIPRATLSAAQHRSASFIGFFPAGIKRTGPGRLTLRRACWYPERDDTPGRKDERR